MKWGVIMEVFGGIQLSRSDQQHLYIQLYRGIKELIYTGKLKGGERIPPIRKMAELLGINNVTVIKAYEILEKENLIHKRRGSGSYVSLALPQHSKERKSTYALPPIHDEQELPQLKQGLIRVEENMINFASGTPSPELFPVAAFKNALNQVLDRDQGYAFGYQEGQGYYPLREALKGILSQKGMLEDTENIHIISGAQQGIDIASKVLLNHGDYVFVENPTYTGALGAFHSRGARIVDIPLEEDGINLYSLERKIKVHRPKLIYVMPNFHNPTGISYSLEKKARLIELAGKYGFYILEDDYLSELNFCGSDNSTLKSMDHWERVIYIKSFSKILMPGLRLGFLAIPPRMQEHLLLAKHNSDISTSGLLQRAFELYLRSGEWDEHIKFMEHSYFTRFEAMKKCVMEYFPKEVTYRPPQGGVNFWFTLPKDLSAETLSDLAQRRKIALATGKLFSINQKEDQHFRLSIAAVTLEEIHQGVEILGEIIHGMLARPKSVGLTGKMKPIL